uniref:Uncharacterized protein n=1 Tax=Tetranychus urticae TaxID=32264 RepID=T1JWP4_TETUR
MKFIGHIFIVICLTDVKWTTHCSPSNVKLDFGINLPPMTFRMPSFNFPKLKVTAVIHGSKQPRQHNRITLPAISVNAQSLEPDTGSWSDGRETESHYYERDGESGSENYSDGGWSSDSDGEELRVNEEPRSVSVRDELSQVQSNNEEIKEMKHYHGGRPIGLADKIAEASASASPPSPSPSSLREPQSNHGQQQSSLTSPPSWSPPLDTSVPPTNNLIIPDGTNINAFEYLRKDFNSQANHVSMNQNREQNQPQQLMFSPSPQTVNQYHASHLTLSPSEPFIAYGGDSSLVNKMTPFVRQSTTNVKMNEPNTALGQPNSNINYQQSDNSRSFRHSQVGMEPAIGTIINYQDSPQLLSQTMEPSYIGSLLRPINLTNS